MTDEAQIQTLITAAQAVREHAYVPYSQYQVGAALLSLNGEAVFTGCNVENASYPAGICAERAALVKAISEGVRQFSILVVMTDNGGSPCGVCRQMLYEFAPDLRVVMVDGQQHIVLDTTLAKLLPYGFNPDDLG